MSAALKTTAIALLLALLFAVAAAPATLIRPLLPADGPWVLTGLEGSLWNGAGDLTIDGHPAGRAQWRFQPGQLLQARLGYTVALTGPAHQIDAQVAVSPSAGWMTIGGRLGHVFVNQWLAPYDIRLTGDLSLAEVEAWLPFDLRETGNGTSTGTVTWNGGPVSYVLSGRRYDGQLPPLVAYLGDALEAVVYPRQEQTPLLQVRIMPDGFVRLGVTQRLTELAGNPWPGSHADHDVVLEVEEQLF